MAYGGPALASDHTYHWRVRVWDAQGRPSPWSADATFDTGVLMIARTLRVSLGRDEAYQCKRPTFR